MKPEQIVRAESPETARPGVVEERQLSRLVLGEVFSGKRELQAMVRRIKTTENIRNTAVLDALRTVPRSEFAVKDFYLAHNDMALPIGEDQTLTPPSLVAYMTDTLDPKPTDRVLEIGTGSGYQAAILSKLVRDVYSVEIHRSLADRATQTLEKLGCTNVHIRVGDGCEGWPEEGPFDKIIVTCSPEKVPDALVKQLREGGRIVIPVGERYQQVMQLGIKKNGTLSFEPLRTAFAVPMTGKAEQERTTLPDGMHPTIVNGTFAESVELDGQTMPQGWSIRQATIVAQTEQSPSCIRFRNTEPGKPSQAMQPFGVDGKYIEALELTFDIKATDVTETIPVGEIMFYDQHEELLEVHPIGHIRQNGDWASAKVVLDVPEEATYAILNIGLLGNTGQLEIKNLHLEALKAD